MGFGCWTSPLCKQLTTAPIFGCKVSLFNVWFPWLLWVKLLSLFKHRTWGKTVKDVGKSEQKGAKYVNNTCFDTLCATSAPCARWRDIKTQFHTMSPKYTQTSWKTKNNNVVKKDTSTKRHLELDKLISTKGLPNVLWKLRESSAWKFSQHQGSP